ncbi:TPA: hypothetical protein QDA82_005375 [Burkholderia vietnamiensis]|nr:hypothetical protein [Burkholderia vietnamiensis]HDR8954984.1 hypothetical protein [Burkholderia vietnamiensis]
MAWDVARTAQELQRLVAYGVIGLYRSVEVTEILGFQRGQPPTNFLTLAVAEPSEPPASEIPELPFLNQERLVLTGTAWSVGVARYRIPVNALVNTVNHFSQTGEWKAGRAPLQIGTLAAVAPQFVPANSYQELPWNRVLKNNFWEGSHVLELFDTSKPHVRFLLSESRALTSLAELIRPYVSVGIDGLSDRLGNILIQLPVTVISTGVRGSPDGDHTVAVAWHPQVPPRPVRVSAEIYEDFTIEGFDSSPVTTSAVPLKLHSPGGGARTHIWDDQNRVLLGATPVTAFVTSVGLSVHAVRLGEQPAARQFLLPETGDQMSPQSVVLKREDRPHIIGSTPQRPREPWRKNRIFNESLTALQERKEFVQYGGVAGAGRAEAFDDIRWLMKEHGAIGVWLWDPFLNADDVLRTLFFCPHDGAELRALTAGHQPQSDGRGTKERAPAPQNRKSWWPRDIHFTRLCRKQQSPTPPAPSWKDQQAARLEVAKGNCHGLRLEFRIRKSEAGWSFHDRFIIFPREDGPAIAWSLGTSVNSLGRQHHILQKVSNGELIANAFRDLWDKLDAAEYLVWKTS